MIEFIFLNDLTKLSCKLVRLLSSPLELLPISFLIWFFSKFGVSSFIASLTLRFEDLKDLQSPVVGQYLSSSVVHLVPDFNFEI